jgi:hypothetical protein
MMGGTLMPCPHYAGLGHDSAVAVIDAGLAGVKCRPLPGRVSSGVHETAHTGNGLDKTRADALVPQPETGKIGYVHHPRRGRLSPGACY